jgi:GNAT superfamily N-acetyltransferase
MAELAMDERAIEIRPMRREDIPSGLGLSKEAGWNQTETDWNLLLEGGSRGNLVACYQGVLVGTVTLISYQERFHWVGMMLVAAEYQRCGIGRALLSATLAQVNQDETVFLDATPAGKKLYDSLGFQEVYGLRRFLRQGETFLELPDIHCSPISLKVLPDIFRYDLPIFGADRSRILSNLHHRASQLAFYFDDNSTIAGYCLGRVGRQYTQIGPIIADRLEIAQALLLNALKNCKQQDGIIDTPFHQPGWIHFLGRLGFRELRSFTRMKLGNYEFTAIHQRQLAIAGPEMG